VRLGIRKFSIKKSLAARASVKRKLRHNGGMKMFKGGGFLTNHKKASYNFFYSRISINFRSFIRLIFGGKNE